MITTSAVLFHHSSSAWDRSTGPDVRVHYKPDGGDGCYLYSSGRLGARRVLFSPPEADLRLWGFRVFRFVCFGGVGDGRRLESRSASTLMRCFRLSGALEVRRGRIAAGRALALDVCSSCPGRQTGP